MACNRARRSRVDLSSGFEPARLASALVAGLCITCAGKAEAGVRVIWEQGIAAVTSGYDVQNNRTEIRKWYIGASGPDDIKEAILDYVKGCVKNSLVLAANAAYDTPGEASIRLAAAVTTWTQTFPLCMNGNSLASNIKDQFKVGLTERREWIPGAHIVYVAGQYNAELYNLYYKELDKRLPGGDGAGLLRKFAELNAKFEAAKAVSIDIKVPDVISNAAARLSSLPAEESAKLVAGLANEIKVLSSPAKIAEAVPQVLKLSTGTVALIASAVPGSIQNVAEVLKHLPPAPPLPNLGSAIGGDVGKALNDVAHIAAIPGVPSVPGVDTSHYNLPVPQLPPVSCSNQSAHTDR